MKDEKYDTLIAYIKKKESVVVAFSGGVDSSFLAAAAYAALGNRAIAITAVSAVEPPDILEMARQTAKQIGIRHVELEINPLETETFRQNPTDRCYHCKTIILGELIKWAKQNGYQHVMEGSNLDDAGDYRPGMKAVSELGASSPLKEFGYTKAEIRTEARRLNLSVWDHPSSPCLASRIPYGSEITNKILKQIADAEKGLTEIGFSPLRVRHHGNVARIEISEEQIPLVLKKRQEVLEICKKTGYRYITLDLQGFRSGSLNESINKINDAN